MSYEIPRIYHLKVVIFRAKWFLLGWLVWVYAVYIWSGIPQEFLPAHKWRPTTGIITAVGDETVDLPADRSGHAPAFLAQYQVNGVTYTLDDLGSYKKGQSVTIGYDPSQPSVARVAENPPPVSSTDKAIIALAAILLPLVLYFKKPTPEPVDIFAPTSQPR